MKYVHTNIITRDWKRLSRFYQALCHCVPVPPERDLSGPWLDRMTGLEDARIRGVHLRLPGCGQEGPTLEIFQYDTVDQKTPGRPNSSGLGHLAFLVDDVAEVSRRCLELGGGSVGELIRHEYPDGRTLVARYMSDPDGNILEFQSWESPKDHAG